MEVDLTESSLFQRLPLAAVIVRSGGEVVACGKLSDLKREPRSVTGAWSSWTIASASTKPPKSPADPDCVIRAISVTTPDSKSPRSSWKCVAMWR